MGRHAPLGPWDTWGGGVLLVGTNTWDIWGGDMLVDFHHGIRGVVTVWLQYWSAIHGIRG